MSEQKYTAVLSVRLDIVADSRELAMRLAEEWDGELTVGIAGKSGYARLNRGGYEVVSLRRKRK